MKLMQIYAEMRAHRSVGSEILPLANSRDLSEIQAASLLAGLLLHGEKRASIDALLKLFPSLSVLGNFAAGSDRSPLYRDRNDILEEIWHGRPIGPKLWQTFTEAVVKQEVSDPVISFTLMAITLKGVSSDDVFYLADAMKNSGSIYDYRPYINPRLLVRRYPTGAVSEKVALILPSLLANASRKFDVASNFLVARSLGFTGGTWDKLSSIPGFIFPQPGGDTVRLLQTHSVAMCVTQGDVAPCDRIFYQIRSLTGSIESHPLICSSIASKQGALPADVLLLDVRYGTGAFLPTLGEARAVAEEIVKIMARWNLNCRPMFMEASSPNGVAIGNALEVAEAIAVLGSTIEGPWYREMLESQWKIVRNFFVALMRETHSSVSESELINYADTARDSGELLSSFRTFLSGHGVEAQVAERLCMDPIGFFFCHPPLVITSRVKGVVIDIEQKSLGYFVNFVLGAGGNQYGGRRNLKAGCILRTWIGRHIDIGDVLLHIYTNDILVQLNSEMEAEVRSYIKIKPLS